MRIVGYLRGVSAASITAYRVVAAAETVSADRGLFSGAVEAAPDAEGRIVLDWPDAAHRPPEILEVVGPDGLLLLRQPVSSTHAQDEPVILEVTERTPHHLGEVVATNRPQTKIAGVAIRPDGTKVGNAPVVLWEEPADSSPTPIEVTRTDANGYFFWNRPEGPLSRAYATVGDPTARLPIVLDEGQLRDSLVLVVSVANHGERYPDTKDCDCNSELGACGCAAEVTELPRNPDSSALTSSPETYSVDLGGGRCVDFTTPNRALEEYSFYQIVRTTQPLILGRPKPAHPTTPAALGARPTSKQSTVTLFPQDMNSNAQLDSRAMQRITANPTRFTDSGLRSAELTAALDLIQAKVTEGIADKPRTALSAKNSVNWETTPTSSQATTIAHGHLLQFKQVWVADGYSLGDLLYSLPLAPGESKQIAVLDWQRQESAERDESVTATDALQAELSRERDISDIVSAVLRENTSGGSHASNWGVGGGLGAAASYLGMGATLGVAGGAGGASTQGWQDSSRALSGNALQQLRDRTIQSSSDLRTARRTVVTTLKQGETTRAETSSVRNHNHCHALTIQYFEVLRHFQVRQELAGVQECLLVPLLMGNFDGPKTLAWRESLRAALRDLSLVNGFEAIERINSHYEAIDWPSARFADDQMEHVSGQLTMRMVIRRPPDDSNGHYDEKAWMFLPTLLANAGIPLGGLDPKKPLAMVGAVVGTAVELLNPLNVIDSIGDLFGGSSSPPPPPEKSDAEKDALFRERVAPLIAAAYVRSLMFTASSSTGAKKLGSMKATLLDEYSPGTPLRVSINMNSKPNLSRAQMDSILVTGHPDSLPASSSAILHTASLNYRTSHFQHKLTSGQIIDQDLPGSAALIDTPLDDTEKRNPKLEDIENGKRLLAHLNDHIEYYHREIWIRMDPGRRYMMLDGVAAPPPNTEGRSVASVVTNDVIGIVGNSLVLPVAPGYHLDPTYVEAMDTIASLRDVYEPRPPVPPMRISVPTRGVFAEAVMGACNSCERIDDSRFWQFSDDPPPTGIEPINTGSRRSDPGDLTAKDLPQPIIAMQTAPAAPDPAGLGGALQALSALGAFRDVAGVPGTQNAALAAMQSALTAAQNFSSQASSLAALGKIAQQAQVNTNSDRISRSIDNAQAAGHLPPQQAGALKQDAIRQMIGTTGQASSSDLVNIRQAREAGLLTDEQASNLTAEAMARMSSAGGDVLHSPELRDFVTAASDSSDSSITYSRSGDTESLGIDKKNGSTGLGASGGDWLKDGVWVSRCMGIDVSQHQGVIDWSKVETWRAANGNAIDFVYMRAVDGTTVDAQFSSPTLAQKNKDGSIAIPSRAFGNWQGIAQQAPYIYRGAYLFWYSFLDPIEQANRFADTFLAAAHLTRNPAAAVPDIVELPPVLDVEEASFGATKGAHDPEGISDPAARAKAIQKALDDMFTCMSRIHDRIGRWPVIYTNPNTWRAKLGDTKRLGEHGLWIAHPDSSDDHPAKLETIPRRYNRLTGKMEPIVEPDVPGGFGTWLFWQMRVVDSGEVLPGVHTDFNVFNGDRERLAQVSYSFGR